MRKKMFITNKKLKRTTYYLLILILMLINVDVCYAKAYSEEFAFHVKHFGNNPSIDRIMSDIDNTLSQNNISIIPYYLYIEEYNNWENRNYATTIGEGLTVTKIAFIGKNAQEVYTTLIDYAIWDSIQTSYCKVNQSTAGNRTNTLPKEVKDLCYQLTEEVDHSNTSSEYKTCDYNFKNQIEGQSYSFEFQFYEGTEGIVISTRNANVNILGTGDGAWIGNTHIYFYEKGKNFANFRTDFISGFNSENKCPEVYFIQDTGDADKWYSTLNKALCDSPPLDLYSGKCQSTSGGMTNSYEDFDAPDFDDLIGEENIVAVCSDLLKEGGALQTTLKWLVRLIKILIPIALIGLGIVDFAKATFSGNEDSMKKSTSKFIKRLIIAVIIFLIPTVLELILKIASGIWPDLSSDFCGIL